MMSRFESGAFEQSSATLGPIPSPSPTMVKRFASVCINLRQSVALPLYTVALVLSYSVDVLGNIAAKIAGDDWPK
jgi:hypothetical protein